MKNFNVPTRDQVTPATQGIFDNLKNNLGMVPNLYAFIGNSENALGSYLTLQQAQAKSTFKAKEREAVFLAISEVNGCDYCRAAHTALGKMNGFSEEETIQLRAGNHPDEKLNVITSLAADIQKTHGKPSEELLDKFFSLGYDDKALVDLVYLIADKVFANYVHNITKFAVDFPAAKSIENAELV